MSNKIGSRQPDVRINFKLFSDEHPVLTRALLQARRGRPRTARLAALAYLGVIAERQGLRQEVTASQTLREPSQSEPDQSDAANDGYQSMLDDEGITELFGGSSTIEGWPR
jgi:hypothetical protein